MILATGVFQPDLKNESVSDNISGRATPDATLLA